MSSELALVLIVAATVLGAIIGRFLADSDLRARIDDLMDENERLQLLVGFGDERARKEAAAKLRARAVEYSGSAFGCDREQVDALFLHADLIEKGRAS